MKTTKVHDALEGRDVNSKRVLTSLPVSTFVHVLNVSQVERERMRVHGELKLLG